MLQEIKDQFLGILKGITDKISLRQIAINLAVGFLVFLMFCFALGIVIVLFGLLKWYIIFLIIISYFIGSAVNKHRKKQSKEWPREWK